MNGNVLSSSGRVLPLTGKVEALFQGLNRVEPRTKRLCHLTEAFFYCLREIGSGFSGTQLELT
ncbi:hypothetical protein SAMN05192533_11968 [Mesobacillus persicus]|uniref:Uncharacterized protein n=1 Tax=Mesobacillus persicus TaxID=930146 RepID=A0A1H8J2P7_9BACI|nr:hypothetical protein SAMN05192533_11968 [Mesobacillus persicus]